MVQRTPKATAALYEQDETAWLETAAHLIQQGQLDAVDRETLAEFLTDLAKRDRREVFSRLVMLLSHLLKWDYQPDRRSGSWRGTILEQQRELRQLLESGTLRNHAAAVFSQAYADARKQAAAETELPRSTLPDECPWNLESALADRGEERPPDVTAN
jgi:hypothetical protein